MIGAPVVCKHDGTIFSCEVGFVLMNMGCGHFRVSVDPASAFRPVDAALGEVKTLNFPGDTATSSKPFRNTRICQACYERRQSFRRGHVDRHTTVNERDA